MRKRLVSIESKDSAHKAFVLPMPAEFDRREIQHAGSR
jgi:hypothetical protein